GHVYTYSSLISAAYEIQTGIKCKNVAIKKPQYLFTHSRRSKNQGLGCEKTPYYLASNDSSRSFPMRPCIGKPWYQLLRAFRIDPFSHILHCHHMYSSPRSDGGFRSPKAMD